MSELFKGLDIYETNDDMDNRKIQNRVRKQKFDAEQRAEAQNTRAALKTPAVLPHMRKMPGDMPKERFDQPRADLVYTRGKGGPKLSKGTPSVPAGLRKDSTQGVQLVSKDGRRKTRAAGKARPKGPGTARYNGRIGMTARPADKRYSEIAGRAAVAAVVTQVERMTNERAGIKNAITSAMGVERDALARGDREAAMSARAEIRRLRKSLKGN